jgi:hypothetical protein
MSVMFGIKSFISMVGSLCAILYFGGGFIGLHCISSYAVTYRGVAPTGSGQNKL